MPIIGSLAAASARGLGGIRSFVAIGPRVGYFVNGAANTGINRIDMLTDTLTAMAVTMSSNYRDPAGFANSGISGAGFRCGGGNTTNSIDKLAFLTETRTTLAAGLGSPRRQLGGFANSGTAGYACGGYDGSYLANINKLLFSNESTSSLAQGMSAGRYGPGSGMANSGVKGYIGGGEPGGGQQNTTITVLDFSNDTNTNLGQNLSGTNITNGKLGLCSFANSGTAGYINGGGPGGTRKDIFKINFSTNTGSLLGNQLVRGRGNASSFANSGYSGYHGGEADGGGTESTYIEKLNFSTDTSTTASPTLSASGWGEGTGFAQSGIL